MLDKPYGVWNQLTPLLLIPIQEGTMGPDEEARKRGRRLSRKRA